MGFIQRNKKDLIIIFSVFLFWAVMYYFRGLPLYPPNGVGFPGDTQSYVDSVHFIETGIAGPDFIPNRLLTNFAYLRLLGLFEKLGNIYFGWILLNSLFYIFSGFILYKIIYRIFQSDRAALFGTILFLGNYVAYTFGLHYLTDMGSLMFYILAAYFTLEFMLAGSATNIYFASLATGIGGLFKEHAMGGYLMIVGAIFYSAYIKQTKPLTSVIITTLISFFPILFVQLSVYLQYDYSYLDWFKLVGTLPAVAYDSRAVEHFKAMLYMYNIGYLLFFYSVYLIWKNTNKYFNRDVVVYLVIILISALPIFIYPGITERLDFIIAPFLILVSCVVIKEYESRWRWFMPFLALYIIITFSMDAYILQPEWKAALILSIKNII